MEDFSRCLVINRILALMCCIFHVFLPAEGTPVSQEVGSKVTLRCNNESISMLTQLTWKMNGGHLFSFIPQGTEHRSQEIHNLNLFISTSESELYALVIETAQKSHTGNYTCEMNTDKGVSEQNWELIITEKAENWDKLWIVVAAVVPFVCFLIFIFTLIILRRVCTADSENNIQFTDAEMQVGTEHIYENRLEIASQPHVCIHANYKPRAH
ncbi:uncharacterized protein [Embiotoca jacksoni]|uniref:uncharacterized protein n=1 Tax=Embiotoca jacksoni TaxID=100190 RepID=UPI00370404A3